MRGSERHAVVLGGGIAGLLTARVLTDTYERVTLVERDPLANGGAERKGAPQGRQAHVLLPRGAEVLEQLFPGLLDELVTAGVPVSSSPAEAWICFNGHVLCRTGPAGEPGYLPSRPYLEAHVRERVRDLPGAIVRDECEVVDLVATDAGDRITGVRVRTPGAGDRAMRADLVVDATGRTGRTPGWLTALGYRPPVEERIPVDVKYASRRIRLRPGALGELRVVTIAAEAARPTGVTLLAQEHDHWIVGVVGYAGHHPPSDPERLADFVERIAPAPVCAAIRDGEPLGPVSVHRFPASVRRRYERLRRFPDGLLVAGDAVCSFNPIYGQGMTVAALQALALRSALASGDVGLAARYFRAAARPVDRAWQLAAGADLALVSTPGTASASVHAVDAYVRRFQAAAAHDPVLARQFVRVAGLLDPPTRLVAPSSVLRVLAGNLRRRSGPTGETSEPAGLPEATP